MQPHTWEKFPHLSSSQTIQSMRTAKFLHPANTAKRSRPSLKEFDLPANNSSGKKQRVDILQHLTDIDDAERLGGLKMLYSIAEESFEAAYEGLASNNPSAKEKSKMKKEELLETVPKKFHEKWLRLPVDIRDTFLIEMGGDTTAENYHPLLFMACTPSGRIALEKLDLGEWVTVHPMRRTQTRSRDHDLYQYPKAASLCCRHSYLHSSDGGIGFPGLYAGTRIQLDELIFEEKAQDHPWNTRQEIHQIIEEGTNRHKARMEYFVVKPRTKEDR